jgi:hypothetical protein
MVTLTILLTMRYAAAHGIGCHCGCGCHTLDCPYPRLSYPRLSVPSVVLPLFRSFVWLPFLILVQCEKHFLAEMYALRSILESL